MTKETLILLTALAAFSIVASPSSVEPRRVAFDVHCNQEQIDQAWAVDVVVLPDLGAPFSITVPIPSGTKADAIAALVADFINVFGEDPVLSVVNTEEDGPDAVVVNGVIGVDAYPLDGTGEGHIEIVYQYSPPIDGPPQILGAVDFWFTHLEGADYVFTMALGGHRVDGTPYWGTDSLVLHEAEPVAQVLQRIMDVLESKGYQVALLPFDGIRVSPLLGGKSIESYQLSLQPDLGDGTVAGAGLLYGMKVDGAFQ